MNKKNLLKKIVQGYKNVHFNEMIKLIEAYGFQLSRISGSHHIFVKPDIKEIVNIQNVQGKTKPYQVKQFLSLIEQYNLQMEDDN